MLRLTTFGGVGIRSDGLPEAGAAALPAVPRRALAFLALLAASHGVGLSRDKVIALLWPESDDEHARGTLRQTLHTLRRDLRAPDILLGADSLRLNPEIITSDIREFDSALAAGDLERAAACYAGPFLDGFHIAGAAEFERWVEGQRSEYAGQASATIESLARDAGRRGDGERAVQWWRRLAALDPLNSRVALELMQALAAAGNPAGALQYARVYQSLMREELGTGPDPAVLALVSRLRGGSTALPQLPASTPVPVEKPGLEGGSAVGRQASHPLPPREQFRERLQAELQSRYLIERELERGRDGSVRLLLARDLRHDRLVTLKVLHPSLASMLDVERFLREIKLTARLEHPHIVPLLDSGEVGGRPWYALPHPGGETLRDRLGREIRISAEEALRLTRELAEALEHAHSHGVVHRDVTPENVLLAEGHALLTNLGIARALDEAGGPQLTETGMLVGTPAYMSPEQAAGESRLDSRTDIYSLACVLFEMLAGEPLFSGPTPQAIMAKRTANSSPLHGRLQGVPPHVAAALTRALDRQPDRRFASAFDFAGATATPRASEREPQRGWLRWLGIG
ncbi:MAG: protein kinase [Gemmatimonadales bacterium]|nr:protein kinase [Gemmatimonadales bacterium]